MDVLVLEGERSHPPDGWISPEYPGGPSRLQASMNDKSVKDTFATPSFNMRDKLDFPTCCVKYTARHFLMDFLQWCVLEDESSYLLYVGNWFIPVMILVVYFFSTLATFSLKIWD